MRVTWGIHTETAVSGDDDPRVEAYRAAIDPTQSLAWLTELSVPFGDDVYQFFRSGTGRPARFRRLKDPAPALAAARSVAPTEADPAALKRLFDGQAWVVPGAMGPLVVAQPGPFDGARMIGVNRFIATVRGNLAELEHEKADPEVVALGRTMLQAAALARKHLFLLRFEG